MSNWCTNTLTIVARDADDMEGRRQLADFREKLLLGDHLTPTDPDCLHLLDTFYPMPEKYIETTQDSWGRVTADDGLTWKEWQLAHWGVKLGDCEGHVVDSRDYVLVLHFYTPWDPPIQGLQKISTDYPALRFQLHCFDEGTTQRGEMIIVAGDVVRSIVHRD